MFGVGELRFASLELLACCRKLRTSSSKPLARGLELLVWSWELRVRSWELLAWSSELRVWSSELNDEHFASFPVHNNKLNDEHFVSLPVHN